MEKILFIIYQLLTMSQMGRIILGKTEFEVRRYLPFDSYGMGARTAGLFLKNSFKGGFFFALSFFIVARGDLKYFIISFLIGIAAYHDTFVSWKRRQEVRLLRQLSLFIGELRHAYYRREDVSEAFSEAFHLAGEELKLHLGLIEEAFETGGIPERYKIASPGRFFLVLLSLCQCTIRYGDKDMIFISNLDELQKNIDSDLLKWDREDFIYNSLFLVIVIPVLCLPFMERWAVSQMEELGNFYNDYRGSLIRVMILMLSFPVYLFLIKTKDSSARGVNPAMSYILELPIVNLIFRKLFLFKRVRKGETIELFDRFFPGDSYMQFILARLGCFFLALLSVLYWLRFWRQPSYLFVLSIIPAFGASFLPYLSLAIKGLYYESELEEEISQVRLMMISLSGVSGITAYDILVWVESFTEFLKSSISECIDELGSDEEEAFYQLRRRWKDTAFITMVDDLIASDKIGIGEAFRDLLSRREYYLARRRQDNEFITRKKEAVLNTFMYLPLTASVFLYLILPFLYLSFKNLLEITKSFS